MKTELQYRTFEELLAKVSIDIPQMSLENAIEPQALIQIATKINYEMGLRVNPGRVKLLPMHRGKAKLPADFAVANYALLCDAHGGINGESCQDPGYEKGLYAGLLLAQSVVEGEVVKASTSAAIFTRELTLAPGDNLIEHNLHDQDLLVQVLDNMGNEVFTRLTFTDDDHITLSSDALVSLLMCKVTIYAAASTPMQPGVTCKEAVHVLTTEQKVLIRYQSQSGRRTFFPAPRPLRFVKSRGIDLDCQNLFRYGNGHEHEVWIQNGFLCTIHHEGNLVLSYQSVLEDEDGSLLTLYHPKVNDYYEYALKEKIYENLWLSGEDVFQKLDYIQQRKLQPAKLEARSFVNTPDFADFRRVWDANRKAQLHKYYQQFQ